MLSTHALEDGVLTLRCLRTADIGARYLAWLHDPEVNRYLEVRHNPPANVDELRVFVDQVNASDDSLLLGIFLHGTDHIGNIKLGPINAVHRRADIGIVFGEKSQWGKGYATRAIRLLCDHAFGELKLRRLSAGCYATNTGSTKAFVKAGFSIEATLPDYWQGEGAGVGQVLMGLANRADTGLRPKANLGGVRAIVFIGGGGLMFRTLLSARDLGFGVAAILAPRHADEEIQTGQSLQQVLQQHGVAHQVVDRVGEVDPRRLGEDFAECMALCFGPAWIFPDQVRTRFSAGMLNFNGIPIPHYLGGAHYTWQILNDSRRAGCHIQRIGPDIDRGDILLSREFPLSSGVRTPADYFRENDGLGAQFLAQFLYRVRDRSDFEVRPFSDVDARRLYFPRLLTRENGWIDWSWTGRQIESFCNAFAAPYAGASTYCNGARVFLRSASFIGDDTHPDFHPFCAGLVVRHQQGRFFVAVAGGLLRVEQIAFDATGTDPTIREGDRLFTDSATLEKAKLFRPRLSGTGP